MTNKQEIRTEPQRRTSHQGLLRRQMIPLLSFGITILVCEYFLVSQAEPGSFGYWCSMLSFSAFPLLASAASFRTAFSLEGQDRHAWTLIGLACFSMFCAEGFWTYLEINFSESIPMTAMATTGYVVSPVLFMLGMVFYQDRARNTGFTLAQLGSLGVVFASVVYGYLVVVYQMLDSIGLDSEVVITSQVQGIFILAAPVVGARIVLLRLRGKKRMIMGLVLFGMICLTVEYFSYIYLLVHGAYNENSPFSALYLVGSTAWFIAASEQYYTGKKVRDSQTHDEFEENAKQWETLLPTLMVAGVFIVTYIFEESLSPEVFPLLAGAIVVLVISLGVRNWWGQRVETELKGQLKSQADDLERARDAAEDADIAKSRFLSWVSHETRTPLSGILGFAELLEDRHFGSLNQDQTGFVEGIRESGDHLLALINDLLDITKISMGAVELTLEEVSLAETVAEVVQSTRKLSRGAEVEIVNEVGVDAPTFTADRRRLGQCLENLLSNAVKFTDAHRSVGVRWKIEKVGWLSVEVWDEGIGIAENEQQAIFGEFYQSGRSRDEALGGSGIGLAITRRLIELHGGYVRVDSEVGKGTSFFLALPMDQAGIVAGASEAMLGGNGLGVRRLG
ncbi:MAG: HAMP domain-containing sensor histidine kinase [Myxococcota bacterium]|nr:HAMP domain-containing sensor histidine kinase [Myxococcota bacterium]